MQPLFFALVLVASASGCATVLHGTRETVRINSRPENAEVIIDGVSRGTTPMAVQLDSTAPHIVTVRAPGYTEQVIQTELVLNGGYVFADIVLGFLPLFIDYATRSWYTIRPRPMNVILHPAPVGLASPNPAAAPPAAAEGPR